jgi:hypothetical protein
MMVGAKQSSDQSSNHGRPAFCAYRQWTPSLQSPIRVLLVLHYLYSALQVGFQISFWSCSM